MLVCWNVDEVERVVNVGQWMGWVECEDDGYAWLESCVAWFCGMVLWQAGKTYSDSVDAAGVSVSRAHGCVGHTRAFA